MYLYICRTWHAVLSNRGKRRREKGWKLKRLEKETYRKRVSSFKSSLLDLNQLLLKFSKEKETKHSVN